MFSLIAIREDDIDICVNDLKFSKEFYPIKVTDDVIVIFTSDEHLLKQFFCTIFL